MTKVINLFGGPGAGKSKIAHGLCWMMKEAGHNVEFAGEYCKDLVYEGRASTIKNQLYILGKQYHRLERLRGKVDYIVTDSPLVFGIFYGEGYPESFNELSLDMFGKFDNNNYFIRRNSHYSMSGRIHTLEESKQLDREMLDWLDFLKIQFKIVNSNESGLKQIFAETFF